MNNERFIALCDGRMGDGVEDHEIEHAIDTGGPMPTIDMKQFPDNDWPAKSLIPNTNTLKNWLSEIPLRDAQEVYEFLHKRGCRIY